MKRALVTGAGGFVGANLTRYLLERGYEVVPVVRPSSDRWRLDLVSRAGHPNFDPRVVDLSDTMAVEALAGSGFDVIFHLAAAGAYSWQTSLGDMLDVNVLATDALLKAIRGSQTTFVYAGSSSEYGLKSEPPSETEVLNPNSYYAATKAAGTHLTMLAATEWDVCASSLRLYSVYGPMEDPRRLMPTLVLHARKGSLPPLVSSSVARDFVWIEDVCEAFVLAAETDAASGQVFNIGSGCETSLGELVDRTVRLFGVDEEPKWGSMPERSWDTENWRSDPSYASEILGWRATTELDDGLRDLMTWTENNADG